MTLASFNALIERQLVVAEKADPHHCSRCGDDLDRWYYGFPLPLCVVCIDIGGWGCCPLCLWTCRQVPAGSGVLADHGQTGSLCLGSGQQFTPDQIAAAYAARHAAEMTAAKAGEAER